GTLLFVAGRAMESRVLEAVAAAGFEDLTLAQARTLARVGERGTRLTELAAQAQITKQSAQHLVDQLERAGYVERAPDPSDGRARLVVLSRRARAAQEVARRTEREVEDEWRAHLGDRPWRELVGHLSRLREVTDPWS
ncbi:MAG TPA: MarR family transcriptional regulator, partial [Nocardioides sp.]